MRCICVWPDGTWCDESEVDEFTHRSDDYLTVEVSWDLSEDQVDHLAGEAVRR